MDQEKIGNFIKQIRKENNLSQKEFADRLGVSFQAVSKWENGKNLPDISTLQLIKKEFHVNIDEIIDAEKTKVKKTKKNLWIILAVIVVILIIGIILFLLLNNKKFEFNSLNSMNNDFTISGNVVKTNDRTSLIINNVNYKGKEDNTIYSKIECILYEEKENTKKEITSCGSGEDKTLTNYLEDLSIRMDHHSTTCTMFTTSSMFIEINATTEDNKTITYKIPIEIENENDC